MTASAGRRLLPDQVRDELLSRIHSGALPLGSRIPAEPELGEEFGVSRATIREAVRSLVEAGYLSRVQGSGTYVAFRPRLRHTLERNLSYSKLIKEAGFEPGRRVLRLERATAAAEEAKALGIALDEGVVRIWRVRSADQRPVIYSVDVIPERFVRAVADPELGGSLYALFESLGHTVSHGEATLAPVVADEEVAAALGVRIGTPLLHISQIDYTTAGDAVMFSREWHVPGVFELSLLRRAT